MPSTFRMRKFEYFRTTAFLPLLMSPSCCFTPLGKHVAFGISRGKVGCTDHRLPLTPGTSVPSIHGLTLHPSKENRASLHLQTFENE